MRRLGVRVSVSGVRRPWRGLLLCAMLWAAAPAAQPVDSLAAPVPSPSVVVGADSLVAAVAEEDSVGRTPRGAVLRALAVPGWGQLYNGQTVKAPVAAAGVVAAAAYFVDRQRQYLRFRRAAVAATCLEEDTASDPDRAAFCAEAIAAYQPILDGLNEGRSVPFTFAALSSIRAQARSQRDIGAVVVAVAYALQALDAYVAAELLGFDVSEDLSLGVGPAAGGGALSLRVRL